MALRALARVNLAAIERNAASLRSRLAPGVSLCAVVKADASGHGAVQVSRAALAGGASLLAVATAGEASQLRAAQITAPLLVLGALSDEELPEALAAGAEVVAWNERFLGAVAAARNGRAASGSTVGVHVKLDSGMGRLGTRDAEQALAVARRIVEDPALRLAGAMTHMATADGDLEFVARQLACFRPFTERLRSAFGPVRVHAANSAATLREPQAHFDMVRCGIALYGCDPMNEDPDSAGVEPALELSSYVAAVKLARAGESAGYGRRFVAPCDTWIATIPIGYADGVRRALSDNCEVLIEGRRLPVVGTVSMDNITVALGPDPIVAPGARVILIGREGRERLTVEDMARRIATINHEVLCGISARVPRAYHRDGVPCDG
ncbi:MAG: alanine racemase [Solirubrobacteraceae bacterium]